MLTSVIDRAHLCATTTCAAKRSVCCPQAFLQRMMALCVASHYRNTPNDLILMSDAPAHHLFVLLGPVDETQVSMEFPSLCSAVKQGLEHEARNKCRGCMVLHQTAAIASAWPLRPTRLKYVYDSYHSASVSMSQTFSQQT